MNAFLYNQRSSIKVKDLFETPIIMTRLNNQFYFQGSVINFLRLHWDEAGDSVSFGDLDLLF